MDATPASRGTIIWLTVFIEGGLALLAMAIGWLLSRPPLEQISWTWAAAGQGIVATVPMVGLLILMVRWPVGPLRSLLELVERQLVPSLRNCKLADLALISLAAGVGEELMFRGVLQTWLAQSTGNTWLAVVVAAALFGAAHPISLTYAAVAALIGVYLGWLFVASGNLLAPIVTHAAYDFVALVMLLRVRAPNLPADSQPLETDNPMRSDRGD
jgi:hypothetical protein